MICRKEFFDFLFKYFYWEIGLKYKNRVGSYFKVIENRKKSNFS